MSAELDALLDAVRTNPEDDLPRLALADGCQEQSDEAMRARGEFIHCRCRAAALAMSDPERGRLEGRARDLRSAFELAWLGGVEKLVSGWDFERGCLLVEVTGDSLRQFSGKRLAASPGWRWVIGVRGVLLEWQDVRRLVKSLHPANLTFLSLRDCQIAYAGAAVLGGSPYLAHLTELHLDYCEMADRALPELLNAAFVPRLAALTLSNNYIGAKGTAAIVACEHLGRLVHLDLSRNRIADPGAKAIAQSRHLPALRELYLASCQISNRGGMALATSQSLGRLTRLDLSDNRFNDVTLDALRERFGDRVRL